MASSGAHTVNDLEKYARFHGYNFEDDMAFVRGWERVSSAKQTSEDDKLNAKLFYYSKKFEPVCLKEYKEWLKDKQPTDSLDKQSGPKETVSNNTVRGNIEPEQAKGSNSDSQCTTTALGQSKGSNPSSDAAHGVAEIEEPALNFQQLIQCLQEGRPIPGIKTVNAAPTFCDPTPSTLDRPPKPWEK